jgi:DNA-directed RNA polymerase sigma subunit (sigma70/sigma32)
MSHRVLGNRVVSLDQTLPGTDHLSARELLPDEDAPDPDLVVDTAHFGSRACESVDNLVELEAAVLRRRFGLDGSEGLTLREVGELHDLSRERIRQIQNRALEHLREMLTPELAASDRRATK